jgi:hypothetical protein
LRIYLRLRLLSFAFGFHIHVMNTLLFLLFGGKPLQAELIRMS